MATGGARAGAFFLNFPIFLFFFPILYVFSFYYFLQTADGEVLGKSRVAGSLAVAACIAGRVAAAAPILTIPPLVLMALERRSPLLRSKPWIGTACLMAMVGVSIQVAVPLTFGLFKQTATVPAEWLEPELAAKAPGSACDGGFFVGWWGFFS